MGICDNKNIETKNEEKIEIMPSNNIKMVFENNKIIKIKELSNKRFGILLNNSFKIYNLNNLKFLYQIKLPIIICNEYNNDDKGILDFIELKNYDLVFWSLKKIFFYKLSKDKYKLYQEINKFEKEEKKIISDINFEERTIEFIINSIHELTNGKLICCNSFGLIIYAKINGKYVFESKDYMKIDVRKIIEINENKIILLQRYHYYYWYCSFNNFSSHTYLISIYDIKTKNITKLAENKVTNKDYFGYILFSYLIKNGYLLIRYGNKIDIYDLNNNAALINNDQETILDNKKIFGKNYKILKEEMDIIFLCDYSDNLIITKNNKNKARIYMLKDNSLKYAKDFPYQLEGLKEIIKLTNNSYIMYSEYELIHLKNI